MSLPQVTVVVPVQNHRRTLPALLCALATTDWPELDVVFVDCGSTDGGLELLRDAIATTPRHRLLERHGSGRASALNAGFAQAATGDVVRLHADVVPDGDDWLRRLHAVTLAHPECGIVGAKLTLAGGRVQSCGRNLINGLGIVPEWSDRRWLEDDRDEGSRPTEVDGVAGGLCYIRRATLDATGGLDANFDPVFGDDDDFCLQARWHGFAVFVEPGVRGVHFAPRQTTMTGQLSEPTGVLQRALDARGSLATAWFGYFRAKWGFDPAAPDLHEIRRRYGHTRICWQIGERLLEDLPATPAVDVCFPTWNSMAVLPRAMAQLAATRWSHVAVWITDNGSTDGTVEYLESLRASFPFPLHVECLRQNIGCAQALNLAIERGSAPLVARIDDDTFVEPDWLERLVPRFHQRPYAGVIGPKVLADSAEPALQSGPSRVFPHKFPVGIHEHERASGLARVVTLRGCCNLYRRSVFAEVGLLDPRFSPSQFDEWDHHIAVAVRGYEVLYDGSASVRHLITAGRGATPAALGNFRANLQKSNCKWGEQHFQRLERAIDLSIDGRFLPADGDTGALRARLPAVPSGPPRPVPRDAEEIARWAGVARRRGLVRSAGGPLDGFFADLIAIGNEDLDDGGQGLASTVVRQIMDLGNDQPGGLAFLARFRAFDGDPDGAARTARWASMLTPERPDSTVPAAARDAVLLPRPSHPTPSPGPRVLVLPPAERGDPALRFAWQRAVAALRAAGADAVVDDSLTPSAADFDVVHAFGLGQADTLLGRVQCARATNPAARVVLSSLEPDPRPANWLGELLANRFGADDAELRTIAALAAAGELGDRRTDGRCAEPFPGRRDYERALFGFVDAWIVHSESEHAWLSTRLGNPMPASLIVEGVDGETAPSTAAPSDLPRGGVIQIGPRDLPGNHLPLVLALQGTGIPLSLCGPAAFPYRDARTRRRGDGTLQLLRLPAGDALFPALQQSAVFVWLPAAPASFALPLLAARAGCELVLACDVGAESLFGAGASYVDPLDLPGLRAAVIAARARWQGGGDETRRHQALAGRDARAYGERLLQVYALGARRREPVAIG